MGKTRNLSKGRKNLGTFPQCPVLIGKKEGLQTIPRWNFFKIPCGENRKSLKGEENFRVYSQCPVLIGEKEGFQLIPRWNLCSRNGFNHRRKQQTGGRSHCWTTQIKRSELLGTNHGVQIQKDNRVTRQHSWNFSPKSTDTTPQNREKINFRELIIPTWKKDWRERKGGVQRKRFWKWKRLWQLHAFIQKKNKKFTFTWCLYKIFVQNFIYY